MKNLKEAQDLVDNWAQQFEKPYFSPLSRMTALTEEIGELSRVMNRIYGDKTKKDTESIKNLEEEIGDILFSLICTANAEGIDMDACFKRKMEKVTMRDTKRFQKKGE